MDEWMNFNSSKTNDPKSVIIYVDNCKLQKQNEFTNEFAQGCLIQTA